MLRKKLSYQPIEGTLALLDGDIIVYRLAFTTQDVNENIAISRINAYLDNILFDSGASDYVVFLTGGNNYRKLIYPEYKANRIQEKPKHYNLIREYLMNHEAAMLCEDEEADDAMGYNQMLNYDKEEDLYKSIICTSDKDLMQVSGRHYNFVTGKFAFVTPEEGIYFFYQQLLTGDRVDNIPGLNKVGPVKAKKILGEMSDESTYKEKVLEAYMESLNLTEGVARERINLIGKLLWIRKKPNEMWSF